MQNRGAHGAVDMNVVSAWQLGYTGRGIVVTILDDGIEHNHTDLQLNYVSTFRLLFPLLPLGLIWDVMLVWRKDTVNENCLCVTVLRTIV